MSIANVSDVNATLSKLGLYGHAAQPGSGSLCGGSGSSAAEAAQGGGLASTVIQALSQIGVTGAQSALGSASSGSSSSGSASSGSTTKASQAFKSFMQQLFSVLQSQAAANSATSSASAASATSSGGKHHHGHGQGGGLQSLIQQLSASSTAASSATSTAASANLASLQQSFNNLVSAVGGSGTKANLNSFLTALANDLSPAAHTGNLVSTQA